MAASPQEMLAGPGPDIFRHPFKYLRFQLLRRPYLVVAVGFGVAGPLAAMTLYGARERFLYPDAPLIPQSYPLPAKRDASLTGYDD